MVILYEDEGFTGLHPLVALRPVFDLRCGRFTLIEKVQRLYPREPLAVWVRETHAAVTRELHPELEVNPRFEPPALFLSGRVIFEEIPPVAGPEELFIVGSHVVGFRLTAGRAWKPGCLGRLQLELPRSEIVAKVIAWPWDIVEFNANELEREAVGRRPAANAAASRLPRGLTLVGPRSRLHLARSARAWPGVVIGTETGPVFVDEGAEIRSGTFIEGPCYVGTGTVLDGARVRPGCSFGPQCRIGGEVESSVFQGFANKYHDGFIGHSFIGEWVNLGAMTTNSDLRNDYSPVRVMRGGKPFDTGLLKLGCFIADHVKTAIGTLFNTGAVVGPFANWFESGLSPKEITAFSRGARGRQALEDILFTVRQTMARRGRVPGPAYLALVSQLYERLKG